MYVKIKEEGGGMLIPRDTTARERGVLSALPPNHSFKDKERTLNPGKCQ
jgi:hypothetical protein